MGILLCEQNFRDVWSRNESVRAEIGHILHTDTLTHAAKLVVRLLWWPTVSLFANLSVFVGKYVMIL